MEKSCVNCNKFKNFRNNSDCSSCGLGNREILTGWEPIPSKAPVADDSCVNGMNYDVEIDVDGYLNPETRNISDPIKKKSQEKNSENTGSGDFNISLYLSSKPNKRKLSESDVDELMDLIFLWANRRNSLVNAIVVAAPN